MKRIPAGMMQLFSVALACAVVLSLGLHAVQLDHIHPGDASHGHSHAEETKGSTASFELASYLHIAEKKLLIVEATNLYLLSIFMAALWSIFLMLEHSRMCQFWRSLRSRVQVRNHYLGHCFSKGILHSKRYFSTARCVSVQ